jgi:diguanylate cyclase (GGDEF)-like protein
VKVLIIDDSVDFLRIAKARLAKEGYEVLCATGGPDGLRTARAQQPDLVLLDLDMPEMSGFEVCRQLKADANLCMTPVIFLSGSASSEDKVRGLDVGAVDYVTKPFDAFELRARVRAALRTKHMQDLLIKFGQIDPLTELWNRRALTARLQEEWNRISRHGGVMTLVMADIDHFKQVNDVYGHPLGDELLCRVAAVVREECRTTDVAARYGGDELAILCPEADEREAAELAERCRRGVESIRMHTPKGELRVTMSMGVCDSLGATGPSDLIAQADQTLYEAKQAGRNCVVMHRASGSAIDPAAASTAAADPAAAGTAAPSTSC